MPDISVPISGTVKIPVPATVTGPKGEKGDSVKGEKGDPGRSVTVTVSATPPANPSPGDIWIVP